MLEYRLNEFNGPDSLTLTEVPTPTPGPSQVLVKIHAVSLQYRDLMVAQGKFPMPHRVKPGTVPCSDMAGEIVAVGSSVDPSQFSVGDRVCANYVMPGSILGDLGAVIDGVLAQFKVFEADTERLVSFPGHLSYSEAAALPCSGATAHATLFGPVPGTSGVSSLGTRLLTLQLAVAVGATVILTSSSDEKLAVGVKLGAAHTINYKQTPKVDEEVMKITNGRGADVVIDIGGPSSLVQSMRACAFGGWVQIVGVMEHIPVDLEQIPILAIMKHICMRGVVIDGMTRLKEANKFIEAHGVHPYIDPHEFAFEQAADAYRYMSNQTRVGKVVIRVADIK
ncbi:chaperonin 10-like protein [Roridomyces roridus]|uniref:Chaperonin 10-like protein n=1 Tax=Roridomyces roridus TaxID=1738132 RepID=A0AAD7C748_9AGAR|nr:chaperonin 10-like protein [Roridomyces roridus]